jgi:hypothetical protein
VLPAPPARALACALALPALTLAACTDPYGPFDGGPGGTRPSAQLTVRLLDAGDSAFVYDPTTSSGALRVAPAGGMLLVEGSVWPGERDGDLRRVTDGRVQVNGSAFDGRVPRGARGQMLYRGEGAPASNGLVTITLPRIEGVAPVTLRIQTVARAAGAPATLTAQELRLRLVPPVNPNPGATSFGGWRVALTRAGRTHAVQGSTALGAELVIPVGTLLPGDEPLTASLSHFLGAHSDAAGAIPTGDSYQYSVSVNASLRWTGLVRTPVAP